jgi:hypothetical protein
MYIEVNEPKINFLEKIIEYSKTAEYKEKQINEIKLYHEVLEIDIPNEWYEGYFLIYQYYDQNRSNWRWRENNKELNEKLNNFLYYDCYQKAYFLGQGLSLYKTT